MLQKVLCNGIINLATGYEGKLIDDHVRNLIGLEIPRGVSNAVRSAVLDRLAQIIDKVTGVINMDRPATVQIQAPTHNTRGPMLNPETVSSYTRNRLKEPEILRSYTRNRLKETPQSPHHKLQGSNQNQTGYMLMDNEQEFTSGQVPAYHKNTTPTSSPTITTNRGTETTHAQRVQTSTHR